MTFILDQILQWRLYEDIDMIIFFNCDFSAHSGYNNHNLPAGSMLGWADVNVMRNVKYKISFGILCFIFFLVSD
jgi:hypothetical protein